MFDKNCQAVGIFLQKMLKTGCDMKTKILKRGFGVLLLALVFGLFLSSCGNKGSCKCDCGGCGQSCGYRADYNYTDDFDYYKEMEDNNARCDPSM